MSRNYTYEFVVLKKEYSEEYGNVGRKVKRFLGNDLAELHERFEKWFIKQSYDTEEIYTTYGYVQHAGYVAK